MLASGISQYINPDYLQPLPTTLDAKKSPLALLAQTCSSIGKDPSPSKPIIPPLDKKDKEANDKAEYDKRPSSLGSKGSNGDSGRDSKPGFRTIPPKDIPPLVPISGDKNSDSNANATKTSSSSSATSSSSTHETTNHSVSASSSSTSTSLTSHSVISSRDSRPVSATGSSSQRSASRSGSAREGHDYHNSTPPTSLSLQRHSASASPPSVKSSSAPVSHSSLGLPKPSASHSASFIHGLSAAHPLAAAYPHLSLLDPALQSYHNALAAHSGLGSLSMAAAAVAQSSAAAALKGASSAALSPYVAYARVKTPSGATTLVPVCRDPYCTNCQLTMQNSHLSSACTAPGCSQCAHEKSLTSLTTGALAGLGGAGLPILPPISQASLTSNMSGLSSYHSSLYPLAAHQGLGYVCSWVAAGSEYCGKRFSTSEELLQHLRTHTSSAVEASSLAAYSALGLHPGLAAAAAAGSHSHYPGSPLSPNSLRRTYPTSLSPVSSLLSASRYHPYKSPLGAVPPPAPTAHGLPTHYFSPYSLYGQRLGAAAVP